MPTKGIASQRLAGSRRAQAQAQPNIYRWVRARWDTTSAFCASCIPNSNTEHSRWIEKLAQHRLTVLC